MEQKSIYPDFSAWRKNAIQTKPGITFAPEDFYVLDEQGRKKEFFTWNEAMELEKKILRPNGWRLPTAKEWRRIVREYKTSANIREKLHLGINGFIWWGEMDEYNQSPDTFAPHYRGICGSYWSSTRYGDCSMYNLSFYGSFANTANNNHRDFGYSIRCVAR